MDTPLALQKLFHLRALIQDSPVSAPGDVFGGPKELRPVMQSPVKELVPQLEDTQFFPGWAPPAKSARSTSEEPHSVATIPIPKPFLRTLARYSSLRPSRMLKSDLKGQGQAKKDDVSARQRARSMSMEAGTALLVADDAAPKAICTEHDMFLLHAKSALPPKHRKHARADTKNDVSPPSPTAPSPRPSPLHSSGTSSRSRLRPCRASGRSLDVVTIPGVARKEPGRDGRDGLKRTMTRTSEVTEASNDSQATCAPSSYSWKPPANWAGPAQPVPADEEHGKLNLLGWFTRKKNVEGSKGGSMRVPARLNRTRSLRELKSTRLDDDGELVERSLPAVRGAPVPSGVAVKFQCSRGDGWHEKPMADIIPRLRKLKRK